MARRRTRQIEAPLTQPAQGDAPVTPPGEPNRRLAGFLRDSTFEPHLVAEIPRKLQLDDPDEFKAAEDELRTWFTDHYPEESLLRAGNWDRTLYRYKRG